MKKLYKDTADTVEKVINEYGSGYTGGDLSKEKGMGYTGGKKKGRPKKAKQMKTPKKAKKEIDNLLLGKLQEGANLYRNYYKKMKSEYPNMSKDEINAKWKLEKKQ
jgi:hypothetical protein